jgi:WD40 repeat protein
MTFETNPYKNAILNKTFKGHMMSVSSLDMHPKKSIVATASDDFTWKIWTVPNGDLIMSGEGHKVSKFCVISRTGYQESISTQKAPIWSLPAVIAQLKFGTS